MHHHHHHYASFHTHHHHLHHSTHSGMATSPVTMKTRNRFLAVYVIISVLVVAFAIGFIVLALTLFLPQDGFPKFLIVPFILVPVLMITLIVVFLVRAILFYRKIPSMTEEGAAKEAEEPTEGDAAQ